MSSVRQQSNVLNETNPFRISEQDLNIFEHHGTISDINNQGESSRPKIWQRTGSENARSEWIKGLQDDANNGKGQKKEFGESEHAEPHRMSNIMGNIEKYIASKGNQEEKEVLVDFVAKKREIFLLQMSLSIKREEIRKLNVKATAKEEALRNSEAALEKDALKFDVFLKDNDKKAQDAMRLAEKETKRKIEKVQELKKLNQQLQVVQSSINKYNIGLEECLRFKSFLHALTPHDWIEGKHDEKRKRQRERRRKRIDARRQTWRQEQEVTALEEKLKVEDDCTKKKRRGRSRRVDCEEPQVIKTVARPQTPEFEDEALTSSDEESPMYFEASNQLLQIFSTLEEENLFLIQNTQEAEQSLDEMTERFEESRAAVQKMADTTLDNIHEIKDNIVKRQKHLENMKLRMEGKSSGSQNKEQKLMNGLTKSVKQVYQACGFTFAGATPSTLHMLAEIETKMERVLSNTSTMPEQEFKRENKAKEKKRRETKRAQQQAEHIRLQEERNRKAIERSLLPPKKVGKKVNPKDAFVSY